MSENGVYYWAEMSLRGIRLSVAVQTLRAGNVTNPPSREAAFSSEMERSSSSSSSKSGHFAQIHVFLTQAMRATGRPILGFTHVGRIHERPVGLFISPSCLLTCGVQGEMESRRNLKRESL